MPQFTLNCEMLQLSFCLILVVFVAIATSEPLPVNVISGIINGVTVAPTITRRGENTMPNTGQHPYIISIDTHKGECGGVLIKRNAVLTAAHCTLVQKSFIVTAGAFEFDYLLSQYKQQLRVDLNDIIRHPGFRQLPTGNVNDIAILQLKSNFRLNKYVNTIKLATEDYIGEKALVLGWGTTGGPKISDVLRKADLRIIRDDRCKAIFKKVNNDIINDSMLCAMHDNKMKTTCKGDSGGPLIIPNDKGPSDDVLVGLSSWGVLSVSKDKTREVCNPNYPAIFVRITTFRSWIVETAKLK